MSVRTGSRGQVLCDGCRQCSFGYHCSPCSAAWRQRAKVRSITGHFSTAPRPAREKTKAAQGEK